MSTTKAENTFSDITANTQGVQNGHRGIDSLPLKVTLKAFFLMLKSYWGCKDSIKSWILLVVIISLTSGSVYIATSINSWYKEFWDTIQNYDPLARERQLLQIAIG